MALAHGSGIVTDGLVLAYDNGSSQSWKGAPTTNIVTNTNLDTGWSKGYNTSIQWDDYPPPLGVDSQVVSFIDSNGNGGGYWYSYGDYAPQGDGVTYYTSVWARTVGSNWNVRAYTANNTESGRIWMNTITVPGDGKWHRLEFNAITTANPNDSDSLSFQFSYIPPNQRCWLCAPQMTTGGHYPFVAGTRSTTQALTDWVGGQTITMLSLTDYNSDNTFSFDGTNNTDRGIYLPSQDLNGSYSVEAWFKFDAASSSNQGIVGDTQYGWYRFFITNANKVYAGHINNASGYNYNFIQGATVLSAGTYHHAVHVFDENAGQRIYVNGVLDASNSNSLNFLLTGRGPQWVGQDRPSAQSTRNVLDGTVPVLRIYKNKALSAAEVAKNYNALRGRFGV